MEHQIKVLAEAITHEKLKKLVQTHVKELLMENNHLVIFVENVEPLHELSQKSMDEHMRKALEKVYDPKITYEFKLMHSYEKQDHMGKNTIRREAH